MTNICTTCGNKYKRIGAHWSYSPDHAPKITDKQHEILTGLMLGDGGLNYHNTRKNTMMQVGMITPNYLKYLHKEFGVLSLGVKLLQTAQKSYNQSVNTKLGKNADIKRYHDVYMWKTRTLEQLNIYREWYSTGEKVWPENIKLTPTILKHWYVGDGSLKNNNLVVIYTNNENNNIEKAKKYFKNSGLPEPRIVKVHDGNIGNKSVYALRWSVENSKILFNYMGNPLPDFEYKWP